MAEKLKLGASVPSVFCPLLLGKSLSHRAVSLWPSPKVEVPYSPGAVERRCQTMNADPTSQAPWVARASLSTQTNCSPGFLASRDPDFHLALRGVVH